jgi:AraC-like DNA-binding protein
MTEKLQVARHVNESLKVRLTELLPEPGRYPTAIEGLHLARRNANVRIDCFNVPCIGVIVQGDKKAVIADEEYRCEEGCYIAYGMDLPSVSHITAVSAKKPHLAFSIPLDREIISQLVPGVKPIFGSKIYKGITVAEAEPELLEAGLRLLKLLDTPERIPVLAPMIIREIHYYLLTGPQGEDFRLLGTHENPSNRIARAISWLRQNYRESIKIAVLAAQVNMSLPSFGRHFKQITGMSPIQFQKRLRLYEAQRLMLSEDKNAETAAFEVGYKSIPQFNREYKRQFGEPPHKDIKQLCESVTVEGYKTITRVCDCSRR